MEANELMIGDWVMDGKNIAQITSITCDGIIETTFNENSNIEVIEPIHLTTEILEKNGFGYTECDERTKHFYLGDSCYCANMELHIGTNVEKNNGVYWLNYKYNNVWRILYVHQLQHAFRLFGIKKEIKL